MYQSKNVRREFKKEEMPFVSHADYKENQSLELSLGFKGKYAESTKKKEKEISNPISK